MNIAQPLKGAHPLASEILIRLEDRSTHALRLEIAHADAVLLHVPLNDIEIHGHVVVGVGKSCLPAAFVRSQEGKCFSGNDVLYGEPGVRNGIVLDVNGHPGIFGADHVAFELEAIRTHANKRNAVVLEEELGIFGPTGAAEQLVSEHMKSAHIVDIRHDVLQSDLVAV